MTSTLSRSRWMNCQIIDQHPETLPESSPDQPTPVSMTVLLGIPQWLSRIKMYRLITQTLNPSCNPPNCYRQAGTSDASSMVAGRPTSHTDRSRYIVLPTLDVLPNHRSKFPEILPESRIVASMPTILRSRLRRPDTGPPKGRGSWLTSQPGPRMLSAFPM